MGRIVSGGSAIPTVLLPCKARIAQCFAFGVVFQCPSKQSGALLLEEALSMIGFDSEFKEEDRGLCRQCLEDNDDLDLSSFIERRAS